MEFKARNGVFGVIKMQMELELLLVESMRRKKEARAKELDAAASKYKKYSSEFKKAADTLERDGIKGKSKYMDRMNEDDWSSVYDGGKEHREQFKNSIKELRQASKSAADYAKVYKAGADYLRNNPEAMRMPYKKAIKQLKNQYKDANKKYGWNMAEDYSFVIDDDWGYDSNLMKR